MYATQSILNFSLSLGQLRGVRVHLSLLMFVVTGALVWRMYSLPQGVWLGLLASVVLLMSVVVHQLAQAFVTRATGNELSDIVLWPLGGLTTQAQYASFPAQVQVQVVGPVVNMFIALICLFLLQHNEVSFVLLNPLTAFESDGMAKELLPVQAGLMIYYSNVLLLCVNLLPVAPFDSGRLLRAFLAKRYDAVEVSDVMLRLGLVVGLLGLIGGFIFDQSAIVALSSFVLIVHLHEIGLRSSHAGYFQTESGENYPDDFAELDPDLEDIESYRSSTEDADTDELIARSSKIARRTARRESERQRREEIQKEKEEQQVDAILERIHRHGRDSLKPAELQLLRSVSQRYRKHSGPREPNTETGR
ncbi:MAG: site-2 protease family protein [Planctomycetaceae bacterium]